MKIKTSELSGNALHFAFAIAEGWQDFEEGGESFSWHRGKGSSWLTLETFRPSELWAQGGPIIEREKISIELCFSGSYCEGSFATPTGWKAAKYKRGGALNEPAFCGPTPLIAAMRCYVASKLGREVEIPDELA